jgi:uncharacterized coiled-coil DUF342 family protein
MSDIIERLTELSDLMMDGRPYNDSDFTNIDEAIVEIERLRKERDEARREICQFRSTSYPHDMKEVYEIADSREWDCYKENTNG